MAEFAMGDLGPCEVLFKLATTDATLLSVTTDTLGENLSVNFQYSEDVAPVKTAKTGTAPKDMIYTGSSVSVVVSMTQPTFAQLKLAFPNAVADSDEIIVSNAVGNSMVTDNYGLLQVRRVKGGTVQASSTSDETLTVFVAAPQPNINWVFDESEQRVAEVTFIGFPVATQPSGEDMGVGALFAIGYGGGSPS